MKNFSIIIMSALTLIAIFSCTKEDRFSGSPIGKSEFVNISGIVSTDESVLSSNQIFKFTIALPQSFLSDVSVEATTLAPNGSIRKATVVIPAGQTSAIGMISSPQAISDGSFIQKTDLFLSAISIKDGILGKQYTISSNKITIELGDTTVDASNTERCIVKFDWQGPYGVDGNPLSNDMDMKVKRNGVNFTGTIPPSTTPQSTEGPGRRYEKFSILKTYPDGDYTFEPFAKSLNVTGFDMLPYRFVIVFPTDTSKTYNGSYVGLIAPSLPTVKLTIRKSTSALDGSVTFTPL